MKPFGCKRTEPASPRRANSRSVAARPLGAARRPAGSFARSADVATRWAPAEGPGRRFVAAGRAPARPRTAPNPGAPGRLARRQEPSTRPRRRRGPVGRRRVSGYFPTRLETRTKESNVCASQRCVTRKTTFGAMKVKRAARRAHGRWPSDRTRRRSKSRWSAVRGRLRRVGFGRPGAHP